VVDTATKVVEYDLPVIGRLAPQGQIAPVVIWLYSPRVTRAECRSKSVRLHGYWPLLYWSKHTQGALLWRLISG